MSRDFTLNERSQGVSLNKLLDEWASMAIAQFDAETRFQLRAARGDPRHGLALLDKLERAEAKKGDTTQKKPRR